MKIIEPSILLVRPQLPENIGMTARAMHNCGLKKLIIVSPRESWPNQKACDASANAEIIIKNAKIFDSVRSALSSFNYVIATSVRKRFIQKPHYNNFSSLFSEVSTNKKLAIVFGPESSGLTNEDLMLCDCVFSIPLSKHNQSLNISHSVLLMAFKWYEYFKKNKNIKNNKNNLSTKEDFQIFMDYLYNELNNSGFLYPKEKSHSMFINIQSMFLRAKLSKVEIQTLRGMFKKLINQKKN